MPLTEDLHKGYGEGYYTHTGVSRMQGMVQRFFRAVKNGYLRSRLGYTIGVGPVWWRVLWPLALLHTSGRSGVEADVMYLPARRDAGTLLEVGFGDASMLQRFGELGWRVEGLDVDEVCVESARERGLSVRQGSLAEQGYDDGAFDCIVMRHAQEHVPEPVEFLRECWRILRPGGTLVSIMPNPASWEHKAFGAQWVALEPPRHLFLFGPNALRRTAESAGFEVQRLFSDGNAGWASWIRNIMLRPESFWAQWAPRKVGAVAWHIALRVRLLVDRWAGQEIVLLARKR
jgi:2-polyprenyl-3-methyl-5-hydroxy-6-metoxy-1,4-benzoquinol methylase